MIGDVIQFTLPLATSLLVSTHHVKTPNLSVSLFIDDGKELFIIVATRASGTCFLVIFQTGFAKVVTTAHTQVSILAYM